MDSGMIEVSEMIAPFAEYGANVSVAVYALPISITDADLADLARAAGEAVPRFGAAMGSGQAKMHRIARGGANLLAVGGLMEPDVFATNHAGFMGIPGAIFILGVGPGCSMLPKTELGKAIVDEAARLRAAKPWWKITPG